VHPLELALIFIAPFAVIFGLIRPFVIEPFHIPSDSMFATLRAGDRVVVGKFTYLFEGPERGDVVAFRDVRDPGEVAIKRVVGLAGDTIEIRDAVLFVNGEALRESYVGHPAVDGSFYGPVKVPSQRVFVLGDNRINSRDSRFTKPIPEENILGKVLGRLWPLERAGLL
jgi:signal peptidase I